MSSVRAFLAIPLPQQLQDSICAVQKKLQAEITAARWMHPKNLHLTLHFFGEIEQETLEKIKVSMLSVRRSMRSFVVEVKGVGSFPVRHRPRVIWLGLEPKEQLRQLHLDCGKILRKAGVTIDSRPYTPHLTICRLQQPKPELTAFLSSIGHTWIGQLPVDELVLYESRLHSGGAEHLPLLTVKLDGTDNP